MKINKKSQCLFTIAESLVEARIENPKKVKKAKRFLRAFYRFENENQKKKGVKNRRFIIYFFGFVPLLKLKKCSRSVMLRDITEKLKITEKEVVKIYKSFLEDYYNSTP